MNVTAVILAAGSGTRMKRRENKVLLDLGGRPVIWHSVRPFLQCPDVTSVVLVCKKTEEPFFRRVFDGADILYVTGGETRQQSVANAAAAGVFVKDTIKVVDGEMNVVSTPDRSRLISVHTPQIFAFDLYKSACAHAESTGLQATDDCMLVEAVGHKVKITQGDYENIKITTPGDLALGEAILKMRGEDK